MPSGRTLALFLPHLSAASGLEPGGSPHLERITARADTFPIPGEGLTGLLCRRLLRVTAGDWPVAAFTALADRVPGTGAYWLRADPVHLVADQAHLVLVPPEQIDLAPEEADRLITDLNAAFAGGGWRLARGRSHLRWYLSLRELPAIRTTALERVSGGAIDGCLPEGEQGAGWRRLLTEMQMFLHGHPLNRQREASGRPPVNGLWLWGGGRLPETVPETLPLLGGDEPLLEGIAAWSGRGLVPPTGVGPDEAAILWYNHPAADLLAGLDRLLARRKGEIELLTARAGFRYRPWHRWRFWRTR